jgi:hypothetical protein
MDGENMTITMEELLIAIKTLIKDNISEFKDVKIQTPLFFKPMHLPKCVISPVNGPKTEQGDDNFFHNRKIEIFIMTKVLSSEKALYGEDISLASLCDSVEVLLENNMLPDSNGEARLKNVNVWVESYSIPNRFFVEDIFMKGAMLSYEGEEMPYRNPIVIS